MKIVIAGSRRLPPGHAPRLLVIFLASLSPDAVIVLRRGISTPPGRFEADTARLAEALGLSVEWARPDPGLGREGTYFRDVKMVGEAALVLAWFMPSEAMHSNSGTSHLAEKALDQHVPIYTYTLDADGTVSRWAENDEDEEWAGKVPQP